MRIPTWRYALLAFTIGVLFMAAQAFAQEQSHEHDYEMCKMHESQSERCRCECMQYHCEFYRACGRFEDKTAASACFQDVSDATKNCQESCEAT